MNRKSRKSVFAAALLAGGSLVTLPAAAEFITSEASAEATAIVVTPGKGHHTATITVAGCEGCPLELDADGDTKYFVNKKEIKGDAVKKQSGNPGTVIYGKDDKRALRVRW